ncbi:MAG TPA: flavodoxin domain-containing protein [Candidatus Dormibacteraeota bacterium]|nr:flavodoxin domain-containing protein [Candidatus Dormibacteraeota bacterium]
MHAVVVFESHWGNTEAVARAIAEGLGENALALTTDQATETALECADLIVAGSPVMMFGLPTDKVVEGLEAGSDDPAPDVTHPTIRTWLSRLPRGSARSAAFETKLRWSPSHGASSIDKAFESLGYRRLLPPMKFLVEGKRGPLKSGEIERARAWGTSLARALPTA